MGRRVFFQTRVRVGHRRSEQKLCNENVLEARNFEGWSVGRRCHDAKQSKCIRERSLVSLCGRGWRRTRRSVEVIADLRPKRLMQSVKLTSLSSKAEIIYQACSLYELKCLGVNKSTQKHVVSQCEELSDYFRQCQVLMSLPIDKRESFAKQICESTSGSGPISTKLVTFLNEHRSSAFDVLRKGASVTLGLLYPNVSILAAGFTPRGIVKGSAAQSWLASSSDSSALHRLWLYGLNNAFPITAALAGSTIGLYSCYKLGRRLTNYRDPFKNVNIASPTPKVELSLPQSSSPTSEITTIRARL